MNAHAAARLFGGARVLVHEILREKQPEVFLVLLQAFGISKEDLQNVPGDPGWFDAAWEMTHDAEGRYLDYTSRGSKI